MKKEPIRILQCVSNMDRAGIETMLMNFYRTIDRNEIQFDFLCNKSKPGAYDEEIKSLGGNIYVSPGLNPLKWFKYQKFMKQLFAEHPEYKIIHCQNEAMGFPALYAAKKAGIPVRISHSHNTMTRFDFKWPIKILYKYLLRLVATDYVACGVDAGKYLFGKEVKVIHNAIDINKFVFNEKIRNDIRKNMNLENKFVIGHVGRFEPQKNHKFLINMFYEYQKNNKDSVLMLIGDGSLENDMKELVKKLNISNKVLFLGNIPNVNEMYNAMDVFVLPSLHEGLPVVGVEAQINGLTCLFSTNVTKEVNFLNKSYFLSINSVKSWIESLSDSIRRYSIVDSDKKISIYNIKNITNSLIDFYYKLYKKNRENKI